MLRYRSASSPDPVFETNSRSSGSVSLNRPVPACREGQLPGIALASDRLQSTGKSNGSHYGRSCRLEPLKTAGSPMPWESNIPNSYGWKPTLITLQEFAIQYGAANLEQEMRSSFTPAHMLTLA